MIEKNKAGTRARTTLVFIVGLATLCGITFPTMINEIQFRRNKVFIENIITGRVSDRLSSIHYDTEVVKSSIFGQLPRDHHVVTRFLSTERVGEEYLNTLSQLKWVEEICLIGQVIATSHIEGFSRMERLKRISLMNCEITASRENIHFHALEFVNISGSVINENAVLALLSSEGTRIVHMAESEILVQEHKVDQLLSRPENIEVLDLWNCSSIDVNLLPLQSMNQARSINLVATIITDDSLIDIIDLNCIEFLAISETSISDRAMRKISSSSQLKEIQIVNCELISDDTVQWLQMVKPDLFIKRHYHGN